MTTAATRAKLEEFAEAVTQAARATHDRDDLDWRPGGTDGDLVKFYCPLPGPEAEPHRCKGGPEALACWKGDRILAQCHRCIGVRDDFTPIEWDEVRQDYTETVLDLIGWTAEDAARQPRRPPRQVARQHVYLDRRMTHLVRHIKFRPVAGAPDWGWSVQPCDTDLTPTGPEVRLRSETKAKMWTGYSTQDFLRQHYPELTKLYLALRWYAQEHIEGQSHYVPVICEGERDCDSFNQLMAAIARPDLVAVCLGYNKPDRLAADHLPVIQGRSVIIIGDAVSAGKERADNWAVQLWEHARDIKIVREQLGLKGTPDNKDLTDWITARGDPNDPAQAKAIAKELIDLLTCTQHLIEPPPLKRQHDLTDDGLALQLGAAWQDEARYCAAWGRWLFWDKVRWQQDQTRKHLTRASAFLRRLAMNMEDAKLAAALRTKGTVVDVIYLATAHPELAASAEQWDADPLLLGTPRGTIDLRGGALLKANPDDYITRSTACERAWEGTRAPQWEAFLERIFRHEPLLIPYLQRVCGYALTGLASEHALIFCWGTGGNGKSAFWGTISGVLGDYAHTAAPELLLQTGADRHPTDMAALRGKRLVLMSELSDGQTWNEARLNRLTGGDPITARFMRQDEFTFLPSHTLVMFGNHKPALRSTNEAARRRIQLVPFTQQIPKAEQIKDLDKRLAEAEGPAILSWMIDGCLAWQQQGLAPPEIVRAATTNYINAEDVVAQWMAERLEPKWDGRPTMLHALYSSWQTWANDRGYQAHNNKWFSNQLQERGYAASLHTGKGTSFEVTLRLLMGEAGQPPGRY
jgi:putative DNA primase/helicase